MQSKLLTVFEYGRLSLDKNISLTSRDIRDIERINGDVKKRLGASADFIKLGYENNRPKHLIASSLVGVARIGHKSVQVLPKISRSENHTDYVEQSIRNLLHMLNFTKQFGIEVDIASLRTVRDDFFEVLIFLFANHLNELLKRDIYKQYVEREENLPYIKGRLNINEHLRHNIVFKNRFFVRYDELLEDNRLNQILKYTADLLIKQSTNSSNRKLLHEISFLLSEISLRVVNREDFKKIHFSRLNADYKPILNLCELFISNSSLMLQANTADAFSFVFDMNVLFEEFIGEFIKRSFRNRFEYISLQGKSAKAKHLVEQVYDGVEPYPATLFKLVPDVAFYHDKTKAPTLLLDTKYKILDATDNKCGVSSGDAYQMCAYSQKFECPDVIMLYPQPGDQVVCKTFLVNEDTKLHVRTVDLGLDLQSNAGKNALKRQLDEILGSALIACSNA